MPLQWRNIGLTKWKYKNAEQFTTSFGIRMRRLASPLLRVIIRCTLPKRYVLIKYPTLSKKRPYIFAAGHSFPGELAANIAAIDRNTWLLHGTTDQIDHNPQMYIAWLNGMIYVDKFNKASRNESVKKMARILKNGSSVIMYPEGTLNNSENLYCMPLYPGVFYLARQTGAQVVPIVAQSEHNDHAIRIAAGKPLDFSALEKETALRILRDELSTLRYELCNDYPPLRRADLSGDIHYQHMKNRRDTYMEVKWVNPNWSEEMLTRTTNDKAHPKDVFEPLENVKITSKNAWILAPILLRNQEYKRYDLIDYMNRHWNDKTYQTNA